MAINDKIMSSGELFQELEIHLLNDTKPSVYLEDIYDSPVFCRPPFDMLHKLRQIMQEAKYHPEGDVWNHTVMVVDEAAKVKHQSKNAQVFMWAALLHDIGKAPATKIRKGKITAYNHDRMGAEMAGEFLSYFTDDQKMVNEICSLIRYHMQILYVAKSRSLKEIRAMKAETDINEIALLGLCDRLGRTNSVYEAEQENIRRFLEACKKA